MTIDTRAAGKRSSVFLIATLRADKVETQVKVRNLSSTGALIETKDEAPAVDSPGTFIRKDAEIPYKVVWRQNGKFGIRFDEDIDEDELMVQISNAKRAGAPPPRFRRPGLAERFR